MRAFEWSLDQPGAFDADFSRLRSVMNFDLHGRSILLTGGTGFFGLWLIELVDLLRRVEGMDITVHALSRNPAAAVVQRPVYRDRPWLHFIAGDVRSFAAPAGRIDYVIHGAADTSAAAGAHAIELFDVITGGTRHVLNMANDLACRRVLLLSSGAVYGAASTVDKMPETLTTAPDPLALSSAYGEGKRVCEALGAYMSQQASFDVVTARCFAFVGAGLPLSGHFAIGNFIRDAIHGNDMRLNSTGQSRRSYLYAADLAIWLVTLLLKGRTGVAYNVGSDQGIDILSTAGLVRDTLAPGRSVTVAEGASTSASFYVPEIGRARSEFGLDAWTPLEVAVRRTAEDARRFGLHGGDFK